LQKNLKRLGQAWGLRWRKLSTPTAESRSWETRLSEASPPPLRNPGGRRRQQQGLSPPPPWRLAAARHRFGGRTPLHPHRETVAASAGPRHQRPLHSGAGHQDPHQIPLRKEIWISQKSLRKEIWRPASRPPKKVLTRSWPAGQGACKDFLLAGPACQGRVRIFFWRGRPAGSV